ncbi:MAG: tRNA preQ1(34) S-adenosylmethionine ribosyltransferase-isomerase QueA [Deltaproteobacteria bacterium]|nr:tRNA preQ1(34) S-adenosylmethionine ribosyltransferase-isomerase QueA [Deltaproteobacteria bacterium]
MEIATDSIDTPGSTGDAPHYDLADFDFDLPPESIAQMPTEQRDQSRLLVLDRHNHRLSHSRVAQLSDFLRQGDLLVFNDTRVLRARLYGKVASGGSVELLLVRPSAAAGAQEWLCLGKPSKRLRGGKTVELAGGASAEIIAGLDDGRYQVRFDTNTDVFDLLSRHGEMPLPPYIRRPDGPLPLDETRYQTIFAAHPGAIAAPTAGLHFTPHLVEGLRARGVEMAQLTLHVGPGTFLPIRNQDYRTHTMDPEWSEIPASTVAAIRAAKAEQRRVIAVGTTTTRALESAATGTAEILHAGASWASRFIVPGYRMQVIDALFTNFHLPGSTLLLLVAALTGRATLLATYNEAIRRGYRFYSYGDAMLIQ